jgi:hypothetical protein
MMQWGQRVAPPSSAGLVEEAAELTKRPGFDAAMLRFCEALVAFHSGRRVANLGAGRTLSWAVATLIVYLDHGEARGVDFTQILRLCEAGGLGARKAVKRVIDTQVATGLVTREARPEDARARRLRPAPALLALHHESLAARLGALELVQPLWGPARRIAHEPPTLMAFLGGNVEAFARAGFRLYDAFPEVRAFMDRACGYLILLELLRQASTGERDAAASATRLAERFDVSRAHVRKLSDMARANGWLAGARERGDFALDPAFVGRLRLWIGAEFVWTWRLVALAAPGAPSTSPAARGSASMDASPAS